MLESYESLLKRQRQLTADIECLRIELDCVESEITDFEYLYDEDDWSYEDGVLGR